MTSIPPAERPFVPNNLERKMDLTLIGGTTSQDDWEQITSRGVESFTKAFCHKVSWSVPRIALS